MTVLELDDLHVTYRTRSGEVPAVRGVSLRLQRGQTLGLAGESGSGKSSLVRPLLRLLPASARVTGTVRFEGEDVAAMSWGRVRAVRWAGASVVFQGALHSLNPVRAIGTQIAEPILVHGLADEAGARQRVLALLEQVGLPARHERSYPHQLSGGQKQRVMIALALACSPRLVIADEPTTALDVVVQAQVLRLLTDLVQQQGAGLVMISHDLAVLAATCSRLAVMYAGRVVEDGPSIDVLRAAQHPYARGLAGAFPSIGDPDVRRAPRGLPGDPPDPRLLPSGCAFHPRCPQAIDACRHTEVRLAAVSDQHQVACLRVTPAAAAGTAASEAGTPASEAGTPASEAPASEAGTPASEAGT
jgi:peptide/nickel transport system ATP-binding protein